MRPLLVLILVLAAAGGFFLVLDKGEGKDTGSGAISGPAGPAAPEDPTPAPTTDLEGVTPADGRGAVEVPVAPSAVVNAPLPGTNAAPVGVGRVTGRVVDEGGSGIQDAEVRLTRYGTATLFFSDPSEARIPDITATTNAAGEYTLQNVPSYDQYALVVNHAKFSRHEHEPVAVLEGKVTTEPDVVLTTGTGLSGRISDSGGNNVTGAKVTLRLNTLGALWEDGTDSEDTTTDSNGRYFFENLAPGNYSLRVEADGYGRVDRPNINVAGTDPVEYDVILEVAHMIAGSARSLAGEPLEGVLIQAWSMTNRQNQSRSQARSDANGEFLIQDVPEGTYRLMAQHPGFDMVDRGLRAETGDMSLQVVMRALPRVRGRVISAATGAPVPSFTVQLRQPMQNTTSTVAVPASRTTVQGATDGAFDVAAPAQGEYQVHVVAPGHADTLSPQFTVTGNGDVTGIEVRMVQGGTLTGRVVDTNGNAVSGARVSSHHKDWADDLFSQSLGDYSPWLATEASAVTSSDGSYTLKNLMPETYQLLVKHPDYAGATQTDIVVIDGNTVKVRDIRLPAGGSVSGTVFGPDGQPLPGALVKLTGAEPVAGSLPGSYTARADERGRFEMKNVKQGRYNAWATRPRTANGNPFQESVDLKFTQRTLTVREGDTLTGEDFKLRDQ